MRKQCRSGTGTSLLLLGISLVLFSSAGCRREPAIRDMIELCDLATVEYRLTKIVMSTRSSFWGTKKIIFQVYATVKAGVDMKDLSDRDMTVTSDSVSVLLPKAKIVSLSIRPEDIVLRYHEQTGITFRYDEKEIAEILRLGEKEIRTTIETNTGLLKNAGDNAKLFVEQILVAAYPGRRISVASR